MKGLILSMALAALTIAPMAAQENAQTAAPAQEEETAPLRIGVAGVTHGHLSEVKDRIRAGRKDFVVVGVAEENDEYRNDNDLTRYLDASVFYKDLEKMLDETKPEAVVAYGSAYDHLKVVKACAPRGIHVMVEKPLAANMRQAKKMKKLAEKYHIMVLTNYETTWYATNTQAKKYIDKGTIGKVFRMNVYDGHQGPVEIGCSPRFLSWLLDPILNGGGAVMDFGCYGANLATWIMNGQKPTKVQAVLHTNKPDVYKQVDDDATILVDYPGMTLQINASWGWPWNHKDMEIFGDKGVIYQRTNKIMDLRIGDELTKDIEAEPLQAPYNDCFRLLKAAVRSDITIGPSDQAALENNMTVMQILTSAIKSAKKGRAIRIR
ncbi:MAG: Gfo/Idh/MocA family oxidoreductase [Bacteroidales bacterium]|nr:Gfo/Idh/MocA family oxidoreductase [Bacteroidales bacterium]